MMQQLPWVNWSGAKCYCSFPIFRCLMVILTMLPRYTQGTICSTMSLCDVVGLIQGVVVTDKEFQSQGQTSGTTATFVIIDGWAIIVTSVGMPVKKQQNLSAIRRHSFQMRC